MLTTLLRSLLLGSILVFVLGVTNASAQIQIPRPSPIIISTDSASIATPSAEQQEELDRRQEEDLTKPEEEDAKREFFALFANRQIDDPNLFNFMGFFVQYAVRSGVPANTIILILLLPFLATSVVVFRNIIGVPTLEMLVPIALAITFISTGTSAGIILLITILFGSTLARFILKRIRIMQLPKMAISMLIVSVCVFVALVISASFGLIAVTQLSFFPVLLLVLLSDKIVGLQLAKGNKSAIIITLFTLFLGAVGYAILSIQVIRSTVLLYPEIILLLIPVNIFLGRYFGLRLTEFRRFAAFRRYVNQ